MTLDLDAVRQVVSMGFSSDARDAFGEKGEDCLRQLLDCVRTFFQVVPPDGLSTTFVFVYWVRGNGGGTEDGMRRIATSVDRGNLAGYRSRLEGAPVVVVGVRSDGRYDLDAVSTPPPLEALSKRSLVFVNENGGVDRVFIGGRSTTLPTLAIGARSNFAVATVSNLREALESYRQLAAHVKCHILAEVWEGGRDGPRLVFRNKPEATMRRSLESFLGVKIEGDVSVRPEHNTDESKPVDLVVDWFGSKQRALIEIKWMGLSLTADSGKSNFTSFGTSRVGEGANQLSDYLSREQSTDPSVSLLGYLAVFDGRRRNVTDPTTRIAAADALHYRDQDVHLAAEHASQQTGIAELVRFFLEPRESHFAAPA